MRAYVNACLCSYDKIGFVCVWESLAGKGESLSGIGCIKTERRCHFLLDMSLKVRVTVRVRCWVVVELRIRVTVTISVKITQIPNPDHQIV